MNAVSLPMYELPEVRKALDSLWSGFRRHLQREGLAGVPGKIVHGLPLAELLNDPNLWFSQCCGYDIVNRYADRLQPIATPHYDAPECEGRDYASVIVVSEDCQSQDVLELHGRICVINGLESHSGMNALRALVAPASRGGRFFSTVKISGSHITSLQAIRSGEADVAAVDCVTYALLQRYRPGALAGTRKLGRTCRAPGIPYVTHSNKDVDTVQRMRHAILSAFADPRLAETRQMLLLKAVEETTVSSYWQIVEFQDLATRHGYSDL